MNIKKHLTWIIPVAIVVIIIMWAAGGYNGMVALDEGVQNKWADVETQYQRRADLIPNLVSTVKGYAAHESETLESVVKARSEATSVKVDPENITPEKLAEYQKAQSGVSQALGRLMVVVEKYPDLKANQNFMELQSQLEGTENRITVERGRFNEAVTAYNTFIRKFPQNIIANMSGFRQKEKFTADAAAQTAPKVSF